MCKGLAMVLAASIGIGMAPSAYGYKSFHDKWVEMYVDETDTSEQAKEYSKLAHGKDRCLVCHKGKTKKECNAYGEHFVGLIGKQDQKDFDKINQALKDVGAKKSKPDESDSKTFAELIKQFEMPGGKFEDLKKK